MMPVKLRQESLRIVLSCLLKFLIKGKAEAADRPLWVGFTCQRI